MTRTSARMASVLSDPSTRRWVHTALTGALDRDPVDAANDAELVARLLRARAQEVLYGAS